MAQPRQEEGSFRLPSLAYKRHTEWGPSRGEAVERGGAADLAGARTRTTLV